MPEIDLTKLVAHMVADVKAGKHKKPKVPRRNLYNTAGESTPMPVLIWEPRAIVLMSEEILCECGCLQHKSLGVFLREDRVNGSGQKHTAIDEETRKTYKDLPKTTMIESPTFVKWCLSCWEDDNATDKQG